MNGWTMGIDGWFWMGAWMLVLVVAVVLLVWAPRGGGDLDDDPIGVLRDRLARGEITPEEFERATSLLATSPTTDGKAHR